MSELDLGQLLEAVSPGGASCLTSITELEPAAGAHASIAPAKFASPDRNRPIGAYAYERRYLDGEPLMAVIVDSKQSQLNRAEAALQLAIEDRHPTLARMPRVEVHYNREGVSEVYSDLTLPHRVFDGHIRAGSIDGRPVTQDERYRAVRDSTPANARPLLDASPISLAFGSWDSSRASRQGRWRSALVGEIVGFCVDDKTEFRGGARVDPVGMQIQLGEKDLNALAEAQRAELSGRTFEKARKEAAKAKDGKRVSVSMLGLGGIPPTLEALTGVACHRIIRSHVLSFATLRQLRFGAGPDGDAACRALLAALALNALARSDAELYLRANCDLREQSAAEVQMDQRGGGRLSLEALSIDAADKLLDEALRHAKSAADVRWDGVALNVTGNPAVIAAAVEDEGDA